MSPAATDSTLVPQRHPEFQCPILSNIPGDRRPSLHQTGTLPSPSLVAARAFFFQHTPPIGPTNNAFQRRGSLFEPQILPRRHSALARSEGLAHHVASLKVFSPNHQATHTFKRTTPSSEIQIKKEEDVRETKLVQDTHPSAVGRGEGEPRPPHYSMNFEMVRRVPFQFTHDHLRDWGYAYLGNVATADVFINAVNLRSPSLALTKEETLQRELSTLVTIRARIHPKAKDRKPFIIQKEFDIEELRAIIPDMQGNKKPSASLRRSNRVRRASTQFGSGQKGTQITRNAATVSVNHLKQRDRFTMPMHIEYALHYLPALAALMLSGHIRRSDIIDLPVPSPEAWPDVLKYIYTGRGIVTSPMRSNILYLAGTV